MRYDYTVYVLELRVSGSIEAQDMGTARDQLMNTKVLDLLKDTIVSDCRPSYSITSFDKDKETA